MFPRGGATAGRMASPLKSSPASRFHRLGFQARCCQNTFRLADDRDPVAFVAALDGVAEYANEVEQLDAPEAQFLPQGPLGYQIHEDEPVIDGALPGQLAAVDAPCRRPQMHAAGTPTFEDLPFAAGAESKVRVFEHAVVTEEFGKPQARFKNLPSPQCAIRAHKI